MMINVDRALGLGLANSPFIATCVVLGHKSSTASHAALRDLVGRDGESHHVKSFCNQVQGNGFPVTACDVCKMINT